MPPLPNSRSNTSLQDSVAVLEKATAVMARELIELRDRAKEDREQQDLDREHAERQQDLDRDQAERKFASKEKFDLLAKLVYWAFGIVGTGILGALVNSAMHVAPR